MWRPKFIQLIWQKEPTFRVSVKYILFRIVSHRNTFLWEIMTNKCLFHSLFSIIKRKNVPVTELVHKDAAQMLLTTILHKYLFFVSTERTE